MLKNGLKVPKSAKGSNIGDFILSVLLAARVSKSHGRATAQKISDSVPNLEICMRKLKMYAFKPFYSVFLHVSHILVGFLVRFFHFFLCKISKLYF